MVSVRPATAGDAPALSALATRTWVDAFGASVSAEDAAAEVEATRSEAYFTAALEDRTILVAEVEGALAGYVELGDAEVNRLYVETRLQGRGIGRFLMEAALSHPRLAGARRVSLQVWEENVRALRLYESLGFRVVGTTAFTIGSGELVEDLVLALERP